LLVTLLLVPACAARPPHPAAPPSVAETAGEDLPLESFSSSTLVSSEQCKTACDVPTASDATPASSANAAAGLEPAMAALRSCLSSMGAAEIDPIIVATFASDGRLERASIDLGGIRAERCVTRGQAALPYRSEASGFVRCLQTCTQPGEVVTLRR
jgi:hypothetical protein